MEPRAETRKRAVSRWHREPLCWLGSLVVVVGATAGCGAQLREAQVHAHAAEPMAAGPQQPVDPQPSSDSQPAATSAIGGQAGTVGTVDAGAQPVDPGLEANGEPDAIPAGAQTPAAVGSASSQPPPVAVPIEIDDLVIDPRARQDDLRGFRVGFRYRWPTPPPPAPNVYGHALVRFATADGQPIFTTVDSPEYRDHGGRLRVQIVIAGPRPRFEPVEIFIPFYVVDLPAGQHQVTALIEVEGGTGLPQGSEVAVTRSGVDAVAVIDKPPVQMVRVLVPRIEVSPGVYDAVILRPHKAAPDLTWSLTVGRSSRDTIHSAGVHWDTYEAEWDQPTPPFPWSEGDGMTVSVTDMDALVPDHLATFSFSYEELLRRAARGAPLSRGRVTHLSLEVRLVPNEGR